MAYIARVARILLIVFTAFFVSVSADASLICGQPGRYTPNGTVSNCRDCPAKPDDTWTWADPWDYDLMGDGIWDCFVVKETCQPGVMIYKQMSGDGTWPTKASNSVYNTTNPMHFIAPAGSYYDAAANECKTCAAGTWSTAGKSSCTACPSGYDDGPAGATAQNQCQTECTRGQRVTSAGGSCGTTAGGWFVPTAHKVNYGSVSPVTYCPNGFTQASTSSTWHYEITDCRASVSAGKCIMSNTIKARYIRVTSNGSDASGWTNIVEMEVFASNNGTGTNLMANATGVSGNRTEDANDGIYENRSHAYGDASNPLVWDLGAAYDIGSIKFAMYSDGRIYDDVKIEVSQYQFSGYKTVLGPIDIVSQITTDSDPDVKPDILVVSDMPADCSTKYYNASSVTKTLSNATVYTSCPALPTAGSDGGFYGYETASNIGVGSDAVRDSYLDCYAVGEMGWDTCASGGFLYARANSASGWGTAAFIPNSGPTAQAGSYFDLTTYQCTACTGATYSAGGDVTSCTACPTATMYASKVTSYWYWSSDNVHDEISGCRAYFSTTTATHGTVSSFSCSYYNGDYGATEGGSGQCILNAETCNAGYYSPESGENHWDTSYATILDSVCVSVGTGYWSAADSLTRTQCPENYRVGSAAADESGCQTECAAGARVLTPNAACTSPAGAWFTTAAQKVNYGSVSAVNYCQNGTNVSPSYTSSSTVAAGHDSVTDCTASIPAGYRVTGKTRKVRYIKVTSTGNSYNEYTQVPEIQAFASNDGTGTNLLAGKSGPMSGVGLTYATDGLWISGASGTYATNQYDLIWDLGAQYDIGSIKFVLYSDGRTYHDVQVQVSTSYNSSYPNVGFKPVLGPIDITTKKVAYGAAAEPYLLVIGGEQSICAAGTYSSSAVTRYLTQDGFACTSCGSLPPAEAGYGVWNWMTNGAPTSITSCAAYAYIEQGDSCVGAVEKRRIDANTWGDITDGDVNQGPGYYVDGFRCKPCPVGTYMDADYYYYTSCFACPELEDGWSWDMDEASTDVTQCRQVKSIGGDTCAAAGQYAKNAEYDPNREAYRDAPSYWGDVEVISSPQVSAGSYLDVDANACKQCEAPYYCPGGNPGADIVTAGGIYGRNECPDYRTSGGGLIPGLIMGWFSDSVKGKQKITECYQYNNGNISMIGSLCEGEFRRYATESGEWGDALINDVTASAGAYIDLENLDCEKCPSGTYQPVDGAAVTECTACPKLDGWDISTIEEGATDYSQCKATSSISPDGCENVFFERSAIDEYSYGNNSIVDGSALPGHYIRPMYDASNDINGASCPQCTSGTFVGGGFNLSCNECPTGYDDGPAGAENEEQCAIYCPTGTRVAMPYAQCTTPAGTWFTFQDFGPVNYGSVSAVDYCPAWYDLHASETAAAAHRNPRICATTLQPGEYQPAEQYMPARFIRISSTGNDLYEWENLLPVVEIQATRNQTGGTNYLRGLSPISETTSYEYCPSCSGAGNATDNSYVNGKYTVGINNEIVWQMTDLNSDPRLIGGIRFALYSDSTVYYGVKIELSLDGEEWKTVMGPTDIHTSVYVSDEAVLNPNFVWLIAEKDLCPSGTFYANERVVQYGNTAECTTCAVGSFTNDNGATYCNVCPAGLINQGGFTECNAECENAYDSNDELAVQSWLEPVWNTDNTVTNLCAVEKCAGGPSGHYKDGNTCPRCDSLADGWYPRSSKNGVAGGPEACFLLTNTIDGHYIETAGGTPVECKMGTYYKGSSSGNVYYGKTSSCKNCAADTYADETGMTECAACDTGYTTGGAKKSTSSDACKINCAGGYYLANAGDVKCTPVGANYWASGGAVSQGYTSTRNMCPAGETTIGFGVGANEAGDCGRILHLGDNQLYLRSDKKTDLALNVMIEDKVYYGNMSTADKFMSSGIEQSLKLDVGGTPYSVYDDSGEQYVVGGAVGVSIDPTLVAVSMVPDAYNTANGETQWSAILADGTELVGDAACSATTGTSGSLAGVGFEPEGAGNVCYCRLRSPGVGSQWVVGTTNTNCATKCAYFCANNIKSSGSTKFRTNLYNAAGITTQ